jgi:hypothetical protein
LKINILKKQKKTTKVILFCTQKILHLYAQLNLTRAKLTGIEKRNTIVIGASIQMKFICLLNTAETTVELKVTYPILQIPTETLIQH